MGRLLGVANFASFTACSAILLQTARRVSLFLSIFLSFFPPNHHHASPLLSPLTVPPPRSGPVAAIGAAAIPAAANAVVDYENIAYLGGGQNVDVNNANIRAYLRMPGMYPAAAGKIVSHGPYKSVADLYNIPGLSSAEKDVIKKNEGRLTAKEPSPEYAIDRINNGLYR